LLAAQKKIDLKCSVSLKTAVFFGIGYDFKTNCKTGKEIA